MPISIKCPGCSKGFKGKDELAGKRIKCPACGHIIAVPATFTSDPITAETPRKSRSTKGKGFGPAKVVGVVALFVAFGAVGAVVVWKNSQPKQQSSQQEVVFKDTHDPPKEKDTEIQKEKDKDPPKDKDTEIQKEKDKDPPKEKEDPKAKEFRLLTILTELGFEQAGQSWNSIAGANRTWCEVKFTRKGDNTSLKLVLPGKDGANLFADDYRSRFQIWAADDKKNVDALIKVAEKISSELHKQSLDCMEMLKKNGKSAQTKDHNYSVFVGKASGEKLTMIIETIPGVPTFSK